MVMALWQHQRILSYTFKILESKLHSNILANLVEVLEWETNTIRFWILNYFLRSYRKIHMVFEIKISRWWISEESRASTFANGNFTIGNKNYSLKKNWLQIFKTDYAELVSMVQYQKINLFSPTFSMTLVCSELISFFFCFLRFPIRLIFMPTFILNF